jgi:RNA polymerase sigma factor (sigma-70 family)
MISQETGAVLQQVRWLAVEPGSNPPDRELLQQFVARHDEAAFATLVRRHGGMVRDVCKSVLHHIQDAEDVCQAVFLVLARKAGSIRDPEALASWLHGVAYRLACKARAAAARRRDRERHVSRPLPAVMDEMTWRDLRRILHEELQRLPEKYRLPTLLCCLEGRTRDEAARQLGWSFGVLKGTLDRGRDLLRQRLGRRGVALSAPLLAATLAPKVADAAPAGATACAALACWAGPSAAGAGLARAAALADALLQRSAALRRIAAVVLAVGVLTAGAGVLLSRRPPAGNDTLGPPAENQSLNAARTDLYGDPLPNGALVRMGTMRLRHGGHVFCVVFARDGKTVISGGAGGEVFVWEVATGKRLRQLKPVNTPMCLALAPDGRTLALGDVNGRLGLWDLAAAKEVRCWKAHSGRFMTVAFAPDGKTLASGAEDDPAVRLWDPATGQARRASKAHSKWVRSAVFSPDGKALATTGSDGTLALWDAVSGRELWRGGGNQAEGWASAVCFAPDGKVLFSGCNGLKPICARESATGKQLRQFAPMKEAIWSLAVLPDGKTLAAAGSDGEFRLWDVATGKPVRKFGGIYDEIFCIALSPDGKVLASAGRDHTVRLWDEATGKELHAFTGHTDFLTAVTLIPDGKALVTGSWDRTVRFWDAATGKQIRSFAGTQARPFPERGDWVSSLAVSPDSKTVAVGTMSISMHPNVKKTDHAVRLWDIASGRELPPWKGHEGSIGSVIFSPDGRRLASRGPDDGTVRLWDVATGKERLRIEGLAAEDNCMILFSPDGRLLAGRKSDEEIGLWDVATGMQVRALRAPQQGVRSLAFTPDGKTLAAGGYTQLVRLWEVATGKERLQFEGAPVHLTTFTLSPDGRTLASASYNRPVSLRDVATGRKLGELVGPFPGGVEAVTFSADGRHLVTGGSDGTALVWDVTAITGRARPQVRIEADQLDRLWSELLGGDAVKAYRALHCLAAAPKQALLLVRQRLPSEPAVDAARIRQLVADLNSDTFGVREKASEALAGMGDRVESLLRAALTDPVSAEQRARLRALVARLDDARPSLRQLRAGRVVELLEQMGVCEGREALEEFAKGAPEAWLTREAKAALHRMARPPGPTITDSCTKD